MMYKSLTHNYFPPFIACWGLLLLLLLSATTNAQKLSNSKKAVTYYDQGVEHFKHRAYLAAEEKLKKAIDEDPKFQTAYMILAEVYWEQEKLPELVDTYKKGLSIDPKFYPQGYLNMAKMAMRIPDYQSAYEGYTTFLGLKIQDPAKQETAAIGLANAQFALNAIAHPVPFEPVSLGDAVNTDDDEYWPTVSADGAKLVITRRVNSAKGGRDVQEDFFISHFADSGWAPMQPMGKPLNTVSNEGAQSISADGKTMVYTVCNRQGVGRCDIYISFFDGVEWSEPVSIGPTINTPAKETQPSLSADGRTIYFASDRAGGNGGLDIWVSHKAIDNTWSEPMNLGDSVNRAGDQMSPFIHFDGATLYFSSNNHIGMGGYDLYKAGMNAAGVFDHVANLGYPINTYKDEFGLIVTAKGDRAYYASNIIPEKGKDIYTFELPVEMRPQEVSYMKGTVYDAHTKRRLMADFELIDLADGKLVGKSVSAESNGEFLLCIPTNCNYVLNVSKPGYLFYSDNFALEGVHHLDEPFAKDIPLRPIKTGESIVLKNIFFETDSYKLKDNSKVELQKLVEFLANNPSLRIEISGHTDNVGAASYNQTLSENRAKSVVDFLLSKGIAPRRLEYKGYGFDKSIAPNDTEQGKALNRRTEMTVLAGEESNLP